MKAQEIMKTNTKINGTMEKRTLVEQYYDLIMREAPITINSYLKGKNIFWMDSYHKDAVVSDVLCKILAKGDQFDSAKSSIKTWIKSITVNALIDYIKLHKQGEDLFFENEDGVMTERPDLVIGMETDPESEMIGEEVAKEFDEFLDGRNEIDREVMSLSILGFKPKEIAQKLSMTATAVSMRIFKMRNAFSEIYAAA